MPRSGPGGGMGAARIDCRWCIKESVCLSREIGGQDDSLYVQFWREFFFRVLWPFLRFILLRYKVNENVPPPTPIMDFVRHVHTTLLIVMHSLRAYISRASGRPQGVRNGGKKCAQTTREQETRSALSGQVFRSVTSQNFKCFFENQNISNSRVSADHY